MNKMTVEEIGDKIGKNAKVVEKEIKNHVQLPEAENETTRWHLKASPEWKHLKQEFLSDELQLIEDKYVKYIEQVKNDITAIEETQVINMIKIEILMHRNLKAQMKIRDTIIEYEKDRQSILNRVDGDFSLLSEDDRNKCMDLLNLIAASRNVEGARASGLLDLQKEFNVINTKLNVSRDQRNASMLDPKFSFVAYVKGLLARDKQESESRFIQLFGLGVKKEEKRLTQAHKYIDGSYDNPILTSEILDTLDDEEKQELKGEFIYEG